MKIRLNTGDKVIYDCFGKHIGVVKSINRLTGIATVDVEGDVIRKHQDLFELVNKNN